MSGLAKDAGPDAGPDSGPDPALEGRRLILCEQAWPDRCVHCETELPEPAQRRLMMINTEGEAVVCSGAVRLCASCDAVYAQDSDFAGIARNFGFDPYALVGFIDLGLLPPDKRDLPIGEDPDLPIPLREFTSMQQLKKARFD